MSEHHPISPALQVFTGNQPRIGEIETGAVAAWFDRTTNYALHRWDGRTYDRDHSLDTPNQTLATGRQLAYVTRELHGWAPCGEHDQPPSPGSYYHVMVLRTIRAHRRGAIGESTRIELNLSDREHNRGPQAIYTHDADGIVRREDITEVEDYYKMLQTNVQNIVWDQDVLRSASGSPYCDAELVQVVHEARALRIREWQKRRRTAMKRGTNYQPIDSDEMMWLDAVVGRVVPYSTQTPG